MSTADALQVRLLLWRPVLKGSLRGFARIRLGSTLVINEVAVFQGNGRSWAGMPGRAMLAADGTAMRDVNGKQRYVPLLEWTSREASDRFSEGVIAAIQREFGNAFAASEGSTDQIAEKPMPQPERRQSVPKGARQHREKVQMPESDIVPF